MSKTWLIVVVIVMLVLSACNDDSDVIIEPEIDVGDDNASAVVQDVRDTRESIDNGLDLINILNCGLGFSTCITATSVVTPTVDLWGSD